ncbi:hypothetical protein GLAREA_11353 [Glarea lozoyensis ATCC 20868]|uniref:Uncharacterized protein n=1 Tax=Glarea lozoyensis (strain ATCC 20868 / MF5171) TaxID=1116229 RepID=S3EBG8_GLAL2|nr:uncharacterized protein GLAREA_11353 [Glarea lozoyensis ATCC 20868]EPE35653.1 hypothetical protein GLAREA_11353 [Glarea lozoyensis ATCC 20868]
MFRALDFQYFASDVLPSEPPRALHEITFVQSMPEPFSVAASAIGLGMTVVTILGFFASTLGTLADKQREYVDADIRQRNYRNLLHTYSMKVEIWSKQWLGDLRDPRPDVDCIHFWGQEGFRGIQQRLEDLQTMLKDLNRKILRETNISSKLLFAFVTSAGFRDRIDRLSKMVDDLNAASTIAFEQLHPRDQAADDHLVRLLHLRDGRVEFSSWMNRLNEQLDRMGPSGSDSWSLLLKTQADEEGIIPDEADISVDFLVENKREESSHWIASLVYSRQTPQVPQMFLDEMTTHPKYLGVSRRPFRSSLSLRPTTWNSLKKERSEAALGLATWTFPLVETVWATNLCTCLVDLAICEESFRTSVLSLRRPRNCTTHQRNGDDLRRHTFLLLGTTLAELILDNAPSFRVTTRFDERSETEGVFETEKETDQGPLTETLSEMRLLSRVSERSRKYKEAVKYCFDLDRRMVINSIYSTQDTDQWVNRVLKPWVIFPLPSLQR